MTYSERAYFHGDHCSHVAAWLDHGLKARRKAGAQRALGEMRKGKRFSPATLERGQPVNPVHAMHAKLAMGWRFV